MADFDTGLQRNQANYAPLTPIDYLQRAASVYGDRLAIVHGPIRQNWAETNRRCKQLAAALRQLGVKRNSTVAVLLHNTPAMVEAHFGVPMSGCALFAKCALRYRQSYFLPRTRRGRGAAGRQRVRGPHSSNPS